MAAERMLTTAAIVSSNVLEVHTSGSIQDYPGGITKSTSHLNNIALLVDLFLFSRGINAYVTNTSTPPSRERMPVAM